MRELSINATVAAAILREPIGEILTLSRSIKHSISTDLIERGGTESLSIFIMVMENIMTSLNQITTEAGGIE